MIKLCVFGGRNLYPTIAQINDAVSSYYEPYDHLLVSRSSVEVVCGMAPGADTQGLLWGELMGLHVEKFYAQWSKGNQAGPERNERMAAYATHGIGFWDGKSRGTSNMAALLLLAGKPVKLVPMSPTPRPLKP